ncbi:nitroreductase [Pseudomonas aeruginosa]|uniref:nitroreductase n=1 Tax=Pseudomonas aeruginosa TaxID=287 RepID=UPI0031B6A30C
MSFKSVSDAVHSRCSVRAFTNEAVPAETLREILRLAARAPSGGNLQPWRVYVLAGEELQSFVAEMQERLLSGPVDPEEYTIYPPNLKAPYRDYRFDIGERLYRALGVEREDREGRKRWFARNFAFFGAPVGLFCFVDRCMGKAQWADLGMFLQTVMLLLSERGYGSCTQEAWALYHRTVTRFVSAPEELMLFCGMAIGRPDEKAPANHLNSPRMPLDDFAVLRGFEE